MEAQTNTTGAALSTEVQGDAGTRGHQRVLLIGASRGLGLAIAQEYLERGAHVVATVRGEATGSHDLSVGPGQDLEIEQLDMNDQDAIRALHDRLSDHRFDLLFVSAGVTHEISETTQSISTEEFTRVMVTNALSPLRVVEELGALVDEDGTIAIMSTGQGSVTNNTGGGWEIYRASKAALNQLTRSYVARRGEGRTVLLTAPGWVRTEMGGEDARLTIQESVPRLVSTIAEHRRQGGLQFVDYRGETVPW